MTHVAFLILFAFLGFMTRLPARGILPIALWSVANTHVYPVSKGFDPARVGREMFLELENLQLQNSESKEGSFRRAGGSYIPNSPGAASESMMSLLKR